MKILTSIKSMKKNTLNLIFGILIGLVISEVSNNFSEIKDESINNSPNSASFVVAPLPQPELELPFSTIAPGLQIIEVPPPLDIDGRVPYQCYFNGQLVKLPTEMVKQFLTDNGVERDENVNIHNFTGNLKTINAPFEDVYPGVERKSPFGRTR
jgi:hypothetical protein